ncbi:MAG: hypothetical protein LBT86_01770 [Deltaproteobacteria bacterium]|nr:hypothetical protein [Deltaproteobacteria bacterium]
MGAFPWLFASALAALLALGPEPSHAQYWSTGPPPTLPIARPNPYDRGNCYQWKRCLGESIGSMPVERPEFCGPLGGKSWKDFDGRCLDLKEGPHSADPPEGLEKPKS